MISTKQAQALRLTCTKGLGMSEGDYKEMLAACGVTSSKQLSLEQFNRLMSTLNDKGSAQQKEGWMSPAYGQMGLIYFLWGQLHAAGKVKHKSNSACLHWMRKYLVQPDGIIEFTPQQKSKCIERLKAWLERE